MEAGACNFFSLIKVSYFRFEEYKIFLTVAQVTDPSYRVKGFGLAQNFPCDVVADIPVL